MNRARRQNSFFAASSMMILLLCTIYGTAYYARALITRAAVTISDDYILSENYRTTLHTELIDALRVHGPQHTASNCKAYSPVLQNLSIKYRLPLHGTMSYDLIPPLAQLNNTAALLENGTLVPADLFSAELLDDLASITVPTAVLSDNMAPHELITLARTVETPLRQRFTINWHDKNTCHCIDRSQLNCTLVCTGNAMPQLDDLQAYDVVLSTHKFDRKTPRWFVDVRFKNQIVVSPDGGDKL